MTTLRSPVIRLTLWYVLIIMVISIGFSVLLYRQTTYQFEAAFLPRAGVMRRLDPRFSPLAEPPIAALLEEQYETAARRVRLQLFFVNLLILAGASIASYFLAKRTLKPIEDALQEQRAFTADASHELRTPLAAMKSEIEVALRREDPSEHRRTLTSALEEIGKLERLSNSLLALARHEAERRDVPLIPVDLEAVAEGTLQRIAAKAKERKIVITRDHFTGLVLGDQASLTDLLVILLDNAVKYSPDGATIHLRAAIGKHVTLTVEDTGSGIRAADLPHVFRRFYRADLARSRAGVHGFGLGLAIAKEIVDRHHGTIAIDSEPSRGTTVTVTLPRSA